MEYNSHPNLMEAMAKSRRKIRRLAVIHMIGGFVGTVITSVTMAYVRSTYLKPAEWPNTDKFVMAIVIAPAILFIGGIAMWFFPNLHEYLYRNMDKKNR